jgi:hypothetical protein
VDSIGWDNSISLTTFTDWGNLTGTPDATTENNAVEAFGARDAFSVKNLMSAQPHVASDFEGRDRMWITLRKASPN